MIARAVNQEDKNDNLFDMNYQYTRTRTWEYRNSRGELESRDEKSSLENKPQRLAARAAQAPRSTKRPSRQRMNRSRKRIPTSAARR